ncbi:unnamed protein product [Tenebrio molitor]|nr:unnamed protein product [Tenebrio molitor]
MPANELHDQSCVFQPIKYTPIKTANIVSTVGSCPAEFAKNPEEVEKKIMDFTQ